MDFLLTFSMIAAAIRAILKRIDWEGYYDRAVKYLLVFLTGVRILLSIQMTENLKIIILESLLKENYSIFSNYFTNMSYISAQK